MKRYPIVFSSKTKFLIYLKEKIFIYFLDCINPITCCAGGKVNYKEKARESYLISKFMMQAKKKV